MTYYKDRGKGYRVHIGYTRNGRNRWRYFDTLALACQFAEDIRRHTRIILSVEYA